MPSTNPKDPKPGKDLSAKGNPKAAEKSAEIVPPKTTEPELDLSELQNKLSALMEQKKVLDKDKAPAKPPAPKASTPLPDGALASQSSEDEVALAEVVRDPFDTKNALKILRDPPGKKLRWISVTYRETKSMRGWTMVRYDDAIGREIDKYIGEPPARMLGSAGLDSVIRRGDVCLAWIDHGIWRSRQLKRESVAQGRIKSNTKDQAEAVGMFGAIHGDGVTIDKNPDPKNSTTLAPGFIGAERGYRDSARGDVNSSAIKTKGSNLFMEGLD